MKQIKFGKFFFIAFLFNNIFSEPRPIGCLSFGTHITPLVTMVLNTKGPILELGTGDSSTPILHALCANEKRYLVSVDADFKWIKNFLDLRCDWHKFKYTKKWDSVGEDRHWSIIFIDHSPEAQRIIDIKRLRSYADVMIIHDTEEASNHVYQFEPYLSTFKYKYIYKRYTVETTIVSDTIDITKFFE